MAKRINWNKEIAIFLLLAAFGVLGLPISIYIVGQYVIGDYSPNAGALDLITAIWVDLSNLRPAAWLLVLSPYIVIALFRASRQRVRSARTHNA